MSAFKQWIERIGSNDHNVIALCRSILMFNAANGARNALKETENFVDIRAHVVD